MQSLLEIIRPAYLDQDTPADLPEPTGPTADDAAWLSEQNTNGGWVEGEPAPDVDAEPEPDWDLLANEANALERLCMGVVFI